MTQVADIIRTTLIQEFAGVQLGNTVYWQVDDLGLDQGTAVNLSKIMDYFRSSVTAVCTTDWKIVCGIFENLTTPEVKQKVFATLSGSAVGNAHPQDQVVRMNRYGILNPGDKPTRSWFNLSGVDKTFSTRGRINSIGSFAPLATFLTAQHVLELDGWTIDPQVRKEVVPGTGNYSYMNCDWSQASSRYFKIASRKTNLCATA